MINSIKELKSFFQSNKDIFVYGAGKVCQTLLDYISLYGINNVTCIIVSDMKNNKKTINGIPVKTYSKDLLTIRSQIIIATLENAQLAILSKLRTDGYENIYVISEFLYEIIDSPKLYYQEEKQN